MSIRQSIRELRRICQDQVTRGGSWYARNFARRISIYFTKLLLYTPITANQTTFLSVLVGIVAGLLFISGDSWHVLGGAVVLQLWYIFDHVDGEIARYRKQTSLTGKYFDYMSHFIVHPYIFASITFGVYNQFHNITVFIFGFCAAISLVIFDLIHWYGQSITLYGEITRDLKKINFLSEDIRVRELKDKNNPSLEKVKGEFKKKHHKLFYIGHIFVWALFLEHYPSIMNVIFIAGVLNLFYPMLKISIFEFNLMYVVILWYAIVLPLFSGLVLFKQIMWRETDRIYYEFLERLRNKASMPGKVTKRT